MSHDPHRISTTELAELAAGLSNLYGDIRVAVRGAFQWTAEIADLGPIAVMRATSTTHACLQGSPAAHFLLLPRQGGARVSSPGDTVEPAPGHGAVLVSPGARYEVTTSGDLCQDVVRMAPGFLAAHLEALTGEVVSEPIRFSMAVPVHAGAGAFVVRLCQFMADEILRGAVLEHRMLMAGLHESLASALLAGQPHSHSHLLEEPPPSSRRVVQIVEEYADAHAGEAIRAADLVALTGAGMASIEAAFREQRGTTPAAFLRARRLERARRRLRTETPLSVMRVAQDAGFLRHEVFEAAYFKAFGESPEETHLQGVLAGLTAESIEGPELSAIEARLALLSPREREVCTCVARGMLNKQIAADLGITEGMVKKHRGRAMAKLGISSAAELASALARLCK